MASGGNVRFGKVNKLLAHFRGMPMICHTLLALPHELFDRRLMVTRNEQLAGLARQYGIEAFVHDHPDVSQTIQIGVNVLNSQDGLLFCVGDQPFLSADTVRALTAAFAREPNRIWRVGCKGRMGNPVLFPRSLFEPLRSLGLGETGSAVIRRHMDMVKVIEIQNELELVDIDTEADFQRYAKGE